MIWFVAIDLERAIKLLDEDKPRHLMSQRHLRQAQSKVSRPPKFIAQAERATYCERQIAHAVELKRGNFFCEGLRRNFDTRNVKDT